MNQLERVSLDLTEFEASTCEAKSRAGRKGGLTIVYSDNGKRLSLSMSILNHLSDLNFVQISYSDNLIAVANYLGEVNTKYAIKKNGNIYNAEIVRELIDRYKLDFSNRTSLTFPVFEVQETKNGEVIYIKMKPSME
ncbi:hypothetical protein [Bacillus sp. FJAT-50079]|uniref:hypothetical protein n=1 Tax=Bacillus sp. FJAT-50079 TaxID=2833577 RepID=UPI001BCA09C3|nr:hypothetical protein [Bacillus sp. FJAT-50079]MBS4207122.1 hypothetical protein [Bacillus sp. FJAT-50079]